jgi:hypothetical protein
VGGEVRLLDAKGAAAYLSLSVAAVRQLIADGVIPTVRPPSLRIPGEAMRRRLVDRADLDRLVDLWKGSNRLGGGDA